MFTKEISAEVGSAAGRLAPPAGVVTAAAAGYTLQDWVCIATLSYVILQSLYLLWRWHRDWRAPKAAV